MAQQSLPIYPPALPPGAIVHVAYSGGLDSTVLLHLLAHSDPRMRLRAVHIHHGLQPLADEWAQRCEKFAGKLGVAFELLRVQVDALDPAGPEGAARTARYEALQWLFFQMASIGPMFGQLGYFHKFAGRELEDKRPLQRYRAESQRLLGVLDARLDGREWLLDGGYSIADIATLGWVRNLIGFYEARELVHYDELRHVPGWLDRCLARPAGQRGLAIPKRG